MNDDAHGALDEQLQRARRGEPAAMAALIRAHQSGVYSLALRMLGTKELAEDLAQEVFMSMSTRLHHIEDHRHLAFWLRKVTAHRAIDQLRGRRRVQLTDLEHVPLFCSDTHADPLLQRHVRQLLRDLSPAARAVLLLRFQEDLDPPDIAAALEMPLNTVKSHLKRSLRTLRRQMSGMRPMQREGFTS